MMNHAWCVHCSPREEMAKGDTMGGLTHRPPTLHFNAGATNKMYMYCICIYSV